MDQMLEAQNERRRARGAPELTEEDIQVQVDEDERWRREQVERHGRVVAES